MAHIETTVHAKFTTPATFRQRIALRLIGVGVVCLTEQPIRNLVRYIGTLWNVGCWTLSERPVTAPTPPTGGDDAAVRALGRGEA